MNSQKPIISFPRNALEQAITVHQGWQQLGPTLQVPNLSLEDYERLLEKANQLSRKVEELHQERQRMVQLRNQVLQELWDLTKRVRNAARATFGDTSKEVEVVMGKPVRPRGRRPKSKAASEA
ncbi:MAG: hypothetical protein Q9P14_14870 [candidate division KSB1 bacterium]|nr:hypothetical protein [candidate division KSB1 bacterium]MDQ7064196.1 hypothetical protein [candidate division KSB1 bacterium]